MARAKRARKRKTPAVAAAAAVRDDGDTRTDAHQQAAPLSEGSPQKKRKRPTPNSEAPVTAEEQDAVANESQAKGSSIQDVSNNDDAVVFKVPDLRHQNKGKNKNQQPQPQEPPPAPPQQHQLEEEIFLVEESIRTLLARQQTLESQQQQSNAKRTAILQVLADQIQRKQRLDESQVSHTRLLQELETSLAKSHDLLLRLHQNSHNHPTAETVADAETTNGSLSTRSPVPTVNDNESQEQEQYPTVPVEGRLEEPDRPKNDHQCHCAESADASMETTTSDNNADGDDEEESLAAFRRCPVPNLHHDAARLAAFWKEHSHLVGTNNNENEWNACQNNLFVFTPCVSSPTVIANMMDVTALEALAEGHRLMMMGSNDTINLSAVAEYRRQTLWNTCLDFSLMMMGTSTATTSRSRTISTNIGGGDRPKDGGDTSSNENSTKDTRVDTPVSGISVQDAAADDETTGVGNEDLATNNSRGISSETTTQSVTSTTEPSDECLLHLDPNVALCPYELAGVCADSFCPYQHLNAKERPAHETILPRELLPLPQLRLPEEPDRWESLEQQSPDLRETEPIALGSDVVEEPPDVGQNENDPATGSVDSAENSAAEDTAKTEALLVGETRRCDPEQADSSGQNPAEDVSPEQDPSAMKEFESNSDFVALNDIEDDDADDEEEDFMNLETAGLVGLMREQPPGLHKEGSAVSERRRPFWWLPASFEVETAAGSTKRMGLEDWLYCFGEFRVTRDQVEASDEDHAVLEYHGQTPTGDVELCEFTGRTVDCARVLLHAGRFDLSDPLCSLAQNCISVFISNYLTESVYGPMLPSTKKVVDIFQKVLDATAVVLEEAYCRQNGLDSTLRFQLTLALVSDFLLRLHAHLTVEADLDADLEWCHDFLEASMTVGEDRDPRNQMPGDIGHTTAKRAHYIRETIKLAVFRNDFPPRHRGANDTDDERQGESGKQDNAESIFERVTSSLLEDIQMALDCASAIRSGFSLHSVAEDYLRPIWSVIKTSLRPRRRIEIQEVPRSTMCLRSFIYITYAIKGALEGAVDFLKSVAGDPHQLSALSFSSLVQLDIACHGILKSLKSIILDDVDTTLLSAFLTPIMGASVSFACHLGLYTKVQFRLEDLLGNSTKDTAAASLFTYSELFWSQLVHLRSTLPFSQVVSPKKTPPAMQTILSSELSESHKQIASKVLSYGVHVHHLCASGDWNILSRLGAIAQEGRPKQAAKQLGICTSLLGTATKPFAVGLRTFLPLPPPASLRRIESECSHLVTFPRSLLVYGWKISSLHLDWCMLRELPHSLGLYLPNLKVGMLRRESYCAA